MKMFENIENLNKTASMAVSAFGIEGKAVFVQISENATYFICQNNKPIYTLRICRPNYHTFEELESEIQWLLNIDDVNICKPISENGEYVKKINDCYCTMYKYIDGIADVEIEGNENLYIEIGRIAGLLHKNTIEKPFNAIRPKWSMENLIGKNGLWGDWRKTTVLNNQQKDIVEKTCTKIYEKVANAMDQRKEKLYKEFKKRYNEDFLFNSVRWYKRTRDGKVYYAKTYDEQLKNQEKFNLNK